MSENKCNYHDDLKGEVSQMGDLARQHLQWQAGFEAKLDGLTDEVRALSAGQRELLRCMTEIKVDLAKNYVTKDDFMSYCDDAEDRIVRIHQRLDEIGKYQRESLWRIILYFAPIAALIFTIITWLFGEMGGNG